MSINVSRPRRVCFSVFFLSRVCPCACLVHGVCVAFSVCSVCLGDCCCLVLAWAALSYLVLVCPVWFCLRVTGLCCLFVVFTLPLVLLPSFVLWVIPFILSFLCSSIRPRRLVSKFFLTRKQIKLRNLPLKGCQKNTLTELETPKYVL